MLFLKSINTKCVSKYLSDLFSIQLALRYSRFLFRLRFPISIIQPSHQVGYTDISHNYYNPVCFLLCRWAYHRYIITGSRGMSPGPVDLSFFICLTVFSISLCVIDCIISFSVFFMDFVSIILPGLAYFGALHTFIDFQTRFVPHYLFCFWYFLLNTSVAPCIVLHLYCVYPLYSTAFGIVVSSHLSFPQWRLTTISDLCS